MYSAQLCLWSAATKSNPDLPGNYKNWTFCLYECWNCVALKKKTNKTWGQTPLNINTRVHESRFRAVRMGNNTKLINNSTRMTWVSLHSQREACFCPPLCGTQGTEPVLCHVSWASPGVQSQNGMHVLFCMSGRILTLSLRCFTDTGLSIPCKTGTCDLSMEEMCTKYLLNG